MAGHVAFFLVEKKGHIDEATGIERRRIPSRQEKQFVFGVTINQSAGKCLTVSRVVFVLAAVPVFSPTKRVN